MKPIERQIHYARLADLHEMRARLFRELDLATMATPAGIKTLAFAATQAAELDDRQAAFFRTQAGAR